jgi:hypothetical protein
MSLGLHRVETITWQCTLHKLAAHFGAELPVTSRVVCVDPKRQWRHYKNIRYNAVIRSTLYALRSRGARCVGPSDASGVRDSCPSRGLLRGTR